MTDPNLYHRLLRRPTNYEFTAPDYHAYEEVRDHFLRTNPRVGRAALMAGGILWRLAIETVERDLVLNGPDSLTYARKITFALRDSADNVFVDDDLSADETYVILGTYIREPVDWNNFEGAGYPMWWPGGHFEGSALDFGWWSPLAEDWYCDLQEKYHAGKSQPRTGREWHNMLRNRDKRARMLTENSKAAAATFLGGIST